MTSRPEIGKVENCSPAVTAFIHACIHSPSIGGYLAQARLWGHNNEQGGDRGEGPSQHSGVRALLGRQKTHRSEPNPSYHGEKWQCPPHLMPIGSYDVVSFCQISHRNLIFSLLQPGPGAQWGADKIVSLPLSSFSSHSLSDLWCPVSSSWSIKHL